MDQDVSEAQARAACERTLASASFARARQMGRLLRYLVDQALAGDRRGTTEYAIGLEVLGRRPADYSPGEDPAVRVQIGRLRRRLKTYNAQWTQPGDVIISIPVGSYMPTISRRCEVAAPPVCADALVMQPIQVIAGGVAGQAFAQGLQEELLDQMVQAFGPVVMGELVDPARGVPRVIVSTLRIDPHRLRASVRLLEAPAQRITWARQFDQAPRLTIDEQEALAASICQALKQHLALP